MRETAMSAEADVSEMSDLCSEIAAALTRSHREKDRVSAVRSAMGRRPNGEWLFSWNRTVEFLRARARRVDSWEKDRARQVRDELKQAEERRRERDHLEWLERQIASGAAPSGGAGNGLVDLLRRARAEAGAVAVRSDNTDH